MGSGPALSRRQLLELSTAVAAGATTATLLRAPSSTTAARFAQDASPAAADVTPGGVLNYAEAGDFEDFNPWAFSAVNMGIYNQVYSRLLWQGHRG